MNILQSALEDALSELPYSAVADLVAERLAAQGVTLTARERRELTKRLKSGTTDTLRFRGWWRWTKDAPTIELTVDDVESIHDGFQQFLETQLPGLITSTVGDTANDILASLHRRWKTERRRQDQELRGFERRLDRLWGPAVDRLRMLITVSRELGESVSVESSKPDGPAMAQPVLLDVLARLHARACQVAEEVLCLLKRGLADGAMARWRTLHEIAIVAFVLQKHGEPLAQRYVDHEAVESYRAIADYRRCSDRLAYEALSESEIDAAAERFSEVVGRYGPTFKTQCGWAAALLKSKNPTLRDIEEEAGIDQLRAHYRMASHNVHANPKGVFFKLGLVGEQDVLLTGFSNAGLTDPGHSTAISLMHVSAAFGLLHPTMDTQIGLRILMNLVDEVGDLFVECQEAFTKMANKAMQPTGGAGR